MAMKSTRYLLAILLWQVMSAFLTAPCSGFVVQHSLLDTTQQRQSPNLMPEYQPSLVRHNPNTIYSQSSVLRRQRRSVASIQTMGLFGLGAAEIAVIGIVIVFLLGPDQIGKMAGNMAGRVKGEYDGLPNDLKKIPEEFQKGYEESTVNARARNAKKMERVPEEDSD